MATTTSVAPRRRIAGFLVPAGLFVLAFAIRCMTWPRVMPGGLSGPVFLFGTDAYYHMRSVLYTLANFPQTLRVDPYINFPHGGEPIWPPTFDFVIAAVALPFHSASNPSAVERFAVFVPPLLGAATVVALYRVARRCFDEPVAVLAGLTLSVLSGHFWYSQLGFVDHHAAVGLVSTLLLGAALVLMQSLAAPPNGWSDARRAAATGLAMSALLLVWPGGLLHVAIVEIALLAHIAFARDEARAVRAARAALVANTLAACLMLPAAATAAWTHWGAFSPTVLSRFQPWLFITLALHAAICVGIWRHSSAGQTRFRRTATALALGIGLLVASVVALPGLVEGAVSALRWLLKEETFQRVVAESQPLFATTDGLDPRVAEARLSRFVYLAPIAVIALGLRGVRRPDGAAVLLLALWTLVLLGVTLLQRRFFDSLSIAFALVMALGLVETGRALASTRVGSTRAGRAATVAALLCVTVWLLFPVTGAYRGPIRNLQQARAGSPITLPPGLVRQRAFHRAAIWLRDNTPKTSGWLAEHASPEYGVMAGWMHGHMLEYVARRPSIADNFGDDVGSENFLASYRYFEAEDDEARTILEKLCGRYVLFRTAVGEELRAFPERSMNHRLSLDVPDVEHLRMIYDEPMPVRGGVSQIRIFESRSHDAGCARRERTGPAGVAPDAS